MRKFEALTVPDIPVFSVLSAFSAVKIYYD
jgi:hypothetical protein